MMPTRRRTRVQDRANRVATERRQNHQARTICRAHRLSDLDPGPPGPGDDPPPF